MKGISMPNPASKSIKSLLSEMPLIAILRGIKPAEAPQVAKVLIDAGFRIIEVPLNSPNPIESIRRMVHELGDQALFGAGTVTDPLSIAEIKAAGGRVIVSPHLDADIVNLTKKSELFSIPGVATPSEAFTALAAGADALKLFPGEACPPKVLKAIKVVLPPQTLLLPVGGINHGNMADYWQAGAAGFGIGSNLYAPGRNVEEIALRANELVVAMNSIRGG
jgi:2-dehydro-3-deoxyphosphogalactonate aldolase